MSKISFTSRWIGTGLAVLAFVGAGCGPDAPTQKEPELPKFDVPEVDTKDDDAPDDLGDVEDDGTVDVGPELPPDGSGGDADTTSEVVTPTCETNDDCGDFTVGACEQAVCDDGECVAEPIESCCSVAADCEGKVPVTNPCQSAGCVDGQCALVAVDGCCFEDDDCQDIVSHCCQKGTCNQQTNTCEFSDVEGCCESSADCSDGNPTTTDLCLETCTAGGCASMPPVCSVNKTFTQKLFDDGTFQGMTVNQPVAPGALWHVTQTARVSPAYSVHFGHPTCLTYYNGPVTNDCELATPLANQGTALDTRIEIPAIQLDANVGVFLSFWVRMSAEPAFPGDGTIPQMDLDFLQVRVNDGSGAKEVWRSTQAFGVANTTNGQFVHQAVNLAAYAGKTVTVGFRFVADKDGNFGPSQVDAWEGVFVDNVRVRVTCSEAFCEAAGAPCPTDGNGCTSDVCTMYGNGGGGVCAYSYATPGESCQSCAQTADCGNDGCFDYSCNAQQCSVALKADCCAPSTTFPTITQPPAVDVEGFEDGTLTDWAIEDAKDDNVTWQVDDGFAFQGTSSLYFGDPATGTFEAIGPDGPQVAEATIWTPVFPVEQEVFRKTGAVFWLWMSTEYDGAGQPMPGEQFDVLRVWVKPTDAKTATEVWTSLTIGNTTGDGWTQVGVDLSAFQGKQVRLGFEFDSGSEVANDGGGVRIDELQVVSVCGDDPCLGQADCDDGDACTTDVCELGECTHIKEDPLCCAVAADCNDSNTCTLDSCIQGTCQYEFNPATINNCCSEAGWPGAWSTSFETMAHGFTVALDTDPVTWHVTDDEASAGKQSLNFSNPATGTFAHPDPTKAVKGQAVSPPILVPPYGKGRSFAEFKLRLSTFWDDTEEPFITGPFVIDELRVKVMVDGVIQAEPVWVSHFLENSTKGQWVKTRADLTAFKGQEVQLVFEFDSGDASDNDFGGPFIDEVAFKTTCLAESQIKCMYGGDCTPINACHTASCSDTFTCVQTKKDTPECCTPAYQTDKALTFEGPAPSTWTFDTCTPGGGLADAASVWKFATSAQAAAMGTKQGQQILYFGNGTDYGGSANKASCGIATSAPITLDPGVPWNMRFWLYLDVEKDPSCTPGVAPFADKFEITVVDDETGLAGSPIFTKSKLACNEYSSWRQISLDLSAYAGKTIRLRYSFSSWDDIENSGKGIGVDHVEFERGCPEPF